MRKMHTNEQNVFFAPYSHPVTNNRSASIRSAHCKSTIHMACKAGYFDVVEPIQFEYSICEWNNSFQFCRTMCKIGKSTVIRYSRVFLPKGTQFLSCKGLQEALLFMTCFFSKRR